MPESQIIPINQYLYFDKRCGRFALTDAAQEIIYREKQIICSYSGANEWCHHFVCELLDLYSGMSTYNYALGCYRHEDEIKKVYQIHKDSVCKWIEDIKGQDLGKKVFSLMLHIIDDLYVLR